MTVARIAPARIALLLFAVFAMLAGSLSVGVSPTQAASSGPTFDRLAGANRYATSAAISRAAFSPGVPVAFIATGANFPDALAAAPAAAKMGGPVLLSAGGSLSSETASELDRLDPARIVLVGGTGVLSDAVASTADLYDTGGGVTRLAGIDRYDTAVKISQFTLTPGGGTVYVATSRNFPDALAAASPAGIGGSPILLVDTNAVPSVVATELLRLAPAKIIIVGGIGVVGSGAEGTLRSLAPSVARLAGDNRYATATKISQSAFGPGVAHVFLATGQNFPDALAGAVAAARRGGPILLVSAGRLPAETAAELTRLNPGRVTLLGGSGVIGDAVLTAARNATGIGGDFKYMPWKGTTAHQQETSLWCVPASIKTMLEITGTPTGHTQNTIYNYGRTQMGYTISGPGHDPQAWARSLNYYSEGRVNYVDSTYSSYDAALRAAISSMRSTGKPAGITINNGTHAWVIGGFLTSNDPAMTSDYQIRGVSILAPFIAWTDPAPGTFYSYSALASKMTPYVEAERWTRWNNTYAVVLPLE